MNKNRISDWEIFFRKSRHVDMILKAQFYIFIFLKQR
jgi:hypothetical protein